MSTLKYDDFRTVFAFIEADDELSKAWGYVTNSGVLLYADNDEQFALLVRRLHGTIDNPVVKEADDAAVTAKRVFGRVELIVSLLRTQSACERVQVGTTTVEQPVYAGTETVEIPVYEWVCPPILAAVTE